MRLKEYGKWGWILNIGWSGVSLQIIDNEDELYWLVSVEDERIAALWLELLNISKKGVVQIIFYRIARTQHCFSWH